MNRTMRLKDLHEDILPGLPNDITLGKIATKLSWRDFYVLSSVSRGWQKAIRSRQVYNARVRSSSTEPLALFVCTSNSINTIALYSERDKSWNRLPLFPTGFRRICQCACVEGKIYVLGGDEDLWGPGCSQMCVLDLAGQRHWKQCANMLQRRLKFDCAVKDGKIYVFGGRWIGRPVRRSEVYDPKVDGWSPIKGGSSRFNHQVSTIGEKLVVYGGQFFARSDWKSKVNQSIDSSGSSDDEDDEEDDLASSESSVDEFEDMLIDSSERGDNENDEEEGLGFSERSEDETEDPLIDFNEPKDDEAEDQLINPFESSDIEAPDVIDGNDDTADEGSEDNADRWPIDMNHDDAEDETSEDESSHYLGNCGGYAMTLEFYHPGKDEWTLIRGPCWNIWDRGFVAQGKLHRMTPHGIDVYDIDKNDWQFLSDISLRNLSTVWPIAILEVHKEILALVPFNEKYLVLRSRGFGTQNKTIAWKKVKCPPWFEDMDKTHPFLRLLQL